MPSRVEKKLNRQVKKYLAPDNDFLENMKSLKETLKQNPDVDEKHVKIIDGFSDFLHSVVNVYDQYEDKNKMALRNLDLSSKELNESNRNLELLNGSMHAVLESLGPALLFFDEDGVCASFYSKSCSKLLECEPKGKNIWDVLKLKGDDVDSFKSLIEFSLNNNSAMSCEDIFEMAPKTFPHSEDKSIFLFYKPIMDATGEVRNILVIGVDKTEEVKAKKAMKEKEAYSEKVIRIAHAKNDYIQVLKNIEEYFLDFTMPAFKNEPSVQEVKKNIHTLKGLAGSFQINQFTKTIHQIESYIKLENPDIETLKQQMFDYIPDIQSCFDNEIEFSESIFGNNILEQASTANIRHEELFNFFNKLKEDNKILSDEFFNEFLTIPIFDALSVLDFHLAESAKLLNKKVYPCKFEGDNARIPIKKYDDLIMSFIHFMRNAVDHGIETPERRREINKDESAQVTIKVEKITNNDEPWLSISFIDDGRGIDATKIKRKLDKIGVDTARLTEKGILMYIFKEEISSLNVVSEISGRGIGLSAVKENVNALNGEVSIKTEYGKGTTFTVKFPY